MSLCRLIIKSYTLQERLQIIYFFFVAIKLHVLMHHIFYEADFWLDDFVKKPNCRIWTIVQAVVMREVQLDSKKLIVWCGFVAGGVIGLFSFFFYSNGAPKNVSSDRDRSIISKCFLGQLVAITWAICSTNRPSNSALKHTI